MLINIKPLYLEYYMVSGEVSVFDYVVLDQQKAFQQWNS